MWRTLPTHWVAVVTNSFGYTALALSCVLVTGCTVVRRTLPSSSAAAAAASALSVVASAAHSSQSSTTTTPERLARPRGGFASFRNKILSSSCGDSSIAKFCSGRYIEEHLADRGVVTLDEQTGRVSELHLLGSTGPALHVHVDAAVDSASQVLRRAGSWVDEVGHILVRVATDPHFIRFLKDAAAERLGEEGSLSDDDDADEGQYEGVRSIHVLEDPTSPSASPSPSASAAAEGEREGDESQPGEQFACTTSQPKSSTSSLTTVPSFSRSSSDSAAAAATATAAATAAAQLVEAAAAGVDSASFLANAPRGHLYAVIRHLNSQLLHVEASLRAAQEESERAEAQRGAFAGTIRTLKANLDRECATRMQLTNQWHRQREEEAREAKRAAKNGGSGSGSGGSTSAAAGGEDGGASGLSEAAHSKQLHAHVRELSKKCKHLSNEHWNASYALSLAGQKNQALQQALEQATKEAAAERASAATRAREHAAAAQELLTRTHEEHARALAKANQESQTRIRALETQRRALEEKIRAQQNAAAATKEAAASAAALAATAPSSTSESETDTSPASSPRTATCAPPPLAVAQLQAQLAEAAHQSRAQAVETARREHHTAAQLERQSAALARLTQEKSALESSVSALQAALQDARSQLSVEQTIVSSLSTAVDDPAAAAAWHASPDARALAAVFSRGPRSSFDLNDGDDEDGSGPGPAAAAALAADEFELLEASDADWTATAAADTLDQQLLAHSVVDSVSSPLVGTAGPAHALAQRGAVQRQSAAPAPPSLLPPAAMPAAAARTSWSLYEHGGPARGGGVGAGGVALGYASLAPSAALWGTAPVALGLQLQLASGTDEHSQLSRQLDALEARVKQLKQQQLQQYQQHQQQQLTQPSLGQPVAAAPSYPVLSWPS